MTPKNKGPTVCINIPPGFKKHPLASILVRPPPGPEAKQIPTKSLHLNPQQPTYKDLLQILYDAAFITDLSGVVLDLNARGVDFFQYEPEDFRGRQFLDFVSGANEALLQSIIQNLENQRFTFIEAYCIRRDGTVFPSEIVVNKLMAGLTSNLCFFVRDCSRRKKIEEELRQSNESLRDVNQRLQDNQLQLVQSEKMAALGQIAAGVAHEINNPIGFVRSNMNTLSEYVVCFKKLIEAYQTHAESIEKGDETQKKASMDLIREIEAKEKLPLILKDVDQLLAEAVEGLDRTKDIVKDLKSFARQDESEMSEVNINDGILATLKIVENELKYKCAVRKNLGKVPSIMGYPGQLNQVLLNLLLNATQAIVEKGTISIDTTATQSHVVVQVSDDGKGIPKDDFSKIFTPFFTTKPIGKGTGLGLSISYGIIRKHGGTIQVQSEEGKGTTFTIQLPIAKPS